MYTNKNDLILQSFKLVNSHVSISINTLPLKLDHFSCANLRPLFLEDGKPQVRVDTRDVVSIILNYLLSFI